MNINPIRVLTTSDRKPPLLPNTEDLHAEKDAEDGLSDEATPSRSGKGGSNNPVFLVTYFTDPGGTFERSGPSPSAIVG